MGNSSSETVRDLKSLNYPESWDALLEYIRNKDYSIEKDEEILRWLERAKGKSSVDMLRGEIPDVERRLKLKEKLWEDRHLIYIFRVIEAERERALDDIRRRDWRRLREVKLKDKTVSLAVSPHYNRSDDMIRKDIRFFESSGWLKHWHEDVSLSPAARN